jgi:hypothetical protein
VKNHPCGVFRFVMGVPKCFIHLKIIHYKDHLAIALPPWLRKPPLLGLGSRTQPLSSTRLLPWKFQLDHFCP